MNSEFVKLVGGHRKNRYYNSKIGLNDPKCMSIGGANL